MQWDKQGSTNLYRIIIQRSEWPTAVQSQNLLLLLFKEEISLDVWWAQSNKEEGLGLLSEK